MAVLTGDNENLKALAKDGTTELHDVSGYYLFDQLPTAVRTWNSTAKKYEYALASYTVEVNGEKAGRRHVLAACDHLRGRDDRPRRGELPRPAPW